MTKSEFEGIITMSKDLESLASPEPSIRLSPPLGDYVKKLDPATLRRRKEQLVEVYADPIHTVLAIRLSHRYRAGDGAKRLSKKVLDEHAKNIVILVLRQIDVNNHWPPDRKMDAEVDRIIDEYLSSLWAQR